MRGLANVLTYSIFLFLAIAAPERAMGQGEPQKELDEKNKKREVVSSMLVLGQVEKLQAKAANAKLPRNIKLGLPRVMEGLPSQDGLYCPGESSYLRIGNPHRLSGTPFELEARRLASFELRAVSMNDATQVRKRLGAINDSPFYGIYKYDDRDFPQYWCRYTKYIDLSDVRTRDLLFFLTESRSILNVKTPPEGPAMSILFPESWLPTLFTVNRIKGIWVECFVGTDSEGVPVAPVEPVLRPIGLDTGAKLFLVWEQIEKTKYDPNYSFRVPFHGVMFESPWSGSEADRRLARTIEKRFLSEVQTQLEQSPISAEKLKNMPLPPQQLRMRRSFKKSLVLNGFAGPYFELSTYNITLWFDEKAKPGFLTTRAEVSHVLTLSVGSRGSYKEPTRPQKLNTLQLSTPQFARRSIQQRRAWMAKFRMAWA